RHASLEALQQAALGDKNKAVGAWLEAQQLIDNPRVAESVSASGGWDTALEMVLRNTLQAIGVEGFDSVAGVLTGLTQGELVLLDTAATVNASASTNGVLLSSKVSAPWDIAGLLNGIYAVDDLNAALALRPQLSAHESVITKDGI